MLVNKVQQKFSDYPDEEMSISVRNAVHECIQWLSHTDIRDANPVSPCYGGYFNLYNARKDNYTMMYCEITAYAAQHWVRMYNWLKDKQYRSLAKQAGNFLIKSIDLNAARHGPTAFPYGFLMPKARRINRYFSFDNAICVSALVDLHTLFGDTEYLETATVAGRWLLYMQKPDGSFISLIDSGNDEIDALPIVEGWFGDAASLCAKNAIGLIKLHQKTGDTCFIQAAQKVLHWVLKQQNDNGSFKASQKHDFTVAHGHCYVLEGLLYTYSVLQQQELLDSAVLAAEWLVRMQNKDGSLYKFYGNNTGDYLRQIPKTQRLLNIMSSPRDTGPIAQACRIWLILYDLTAEEKFLRAAQKAINYLLKCQAIKSPFSRTRGGFPASTRKILGRYWYSPIYSPWEAMFACHCFAMFLQEQENDTNRTVDIF